MPDPRQDMVLDAVDQNDAPVGLVPRKAVFERRSNFRVVHDLVFNSKKELLVQQIGEAGTRHPRFWGSSVAGYIFAGESYEAAAHRKLVQELGVSDAPLKYIGKTVMLDEGCHKFISVFTTVCDGPFDLDRSHIQSVEFLARDTIHELHRKGTRKFTPTFLTVLAYYESKI